MDATTSDGCRPLLGLQLRSVCDVVILAFAALVSVFPVCGLGAPNVLAWGDNQYGQANPPADLTNAIAIAAGASHSVAARGDGTAVAWGDNRYSETNVPAGLSNVIAVACGHNHSVALKSDGTVIAWGRNDFGQTNCPAGLSNVVAIAGFNHSSLALRNDGSVVIWGAGAASFGIGNVISLGCLASTPAAYVDFNAVTVSGKQPFWGSPYGASQSADPNAVFTCSSQGPTLTWYGTVTGTGLSALTNIVAIAGLGANTLALRADGTVYNGVSGTSNLVAVAVGGSHKLSLTGVGAPVFQTRSMGFSINTGQTARFYASATGAWPLDYQWRFNGIDIPGATRPMLAVTNVTDADFGSYSVVATNDFGVAVGPTMTLSLLPIVGHDYTANVTDVVAIASCWTDEGLALQRNGQVAAWFGDEHLLPKDLSNVVTISTYSAFNRDNYAHSLAVTASGTLWSWGKNFFTNASPTLTNLVAVSAGCVTDMGLRRTGCDLNWAITSGGAEGSLSASNFVEVSASKKQSSAPLGLRADGSIYGYNNPIGLSNVVSVAAGADYWLALLADGRVAAWGTNNLGQINVPAGLSNVIAIATSSQYVPYSLALKDDGSISAWGAVPPSISNMVATVHDAVMIDGALALLGRGPPFLTTPLVPRYGIPGGRAYFRALATGQRPLRYQWCFNGEPLAGETRNVLKKLDLAFEDAGSYSVVVTNVVGVITSAPASLIVLNYAAALNNSNVAWTSFGDSVWVPQASVTHDGHQALRSGEALSGASILRGVIEGPGVLTFWWRTDYSNSRLGLYLDGAVRSLYPDATGSWQQRTVYLSAGTHTADWKLTGGGGSGYLDEVSFTPGLNLPTITAQWSAGSEVTISWPAHETGWRLQVQTNNPGAGVGESWFDLWDTRTTNSVTVPVDLDHGSLFYRLASP